jgi:hypothetical protein
MRKPLLNALSALFTLSQSAHSLCWPKCPKDFSTRTKSNSASRSAVSLSLSEGVLVAVLLTLTACTVIPHPVKPSTISYSGTNQNSGIVATWPGGGIIDEHKRQRYNALIDLYGAEFHPAVKHDEGLKPLPDGNWRIDGEHLTDLLDMESMDRSKP